MTKFTQATVRLAHTTDAERVAELCQQLGYAASPAEVQQRLEQTQSDKHHAVYVAELSDGQVVGWVHVCICQLVIANRQALILGLIVDKSYRRYGVGKLLMQRAEQWVREKGCQAILLRSNITRKDAHAFYESIGYSNIKTSFAFYKALD